MKMITKAIEKAMDKTPLYSQDGKGKDAKVLFKVFNPYGSGTWYVLEAGAVRPDGDREIYVLTVDSYYGPEYGYMMLSDLTNARFGKYGLPFERDLYFKGTVADALVDAGYAA